MRGTGWGLGLFVFLGLLGCGGDTEEQYQAYLQLAKDNLAAQEEVADILATVKTPADMPAALDALKKTQPRRRALVHKGHEMGKPSAALDARILDSLRGRMQTSFDRMRQEAYRIGQIPGGQEFLDSFSALQ